MRNTESDIKVGIFTSIYFMMNIIQSLSWYRSLSLSSLFFVHHRCFFFFLFPPLLLCAPCTQSVFISHFWLLLFDTQCQSLSGRTQKSDYYYKQQQKLKEEKKLIRAISNDSAREPGSKQQTMWTGEEEKKIVFDKKLLHILLLWTGWCDILSVVWAVSVIDIHDANWRKNISLDTISLF